MSSEIFVLEVQKREITGKKVRALRAKGQIPAVVYGPKQAPINLLVNWPDLRVTLAKAGGTHLVELKEGSNRYTTLIRHVDRHPVKHQEVLHVDFYAVDLSKTIVTSIPLVLLNVDSTATRLAGQIVQELSTIEVESMPNNIPNEIQVDVAVLKTVGSHISVQDLPVIENVSYITEPHTLVVRADVLSDGSGEPFAEAGGAAEPEVISRRKDDDFED